MELNWQYIQENFDWLGHIVEAICIAAVVTGLGLALFKRHDALMMGLAFAAGHFHGREKRDYEVSVHMPPPHLEAYKFWLWNWDQTTDFWPVTIVVLALLLLIAHKRNAPLQEERPVSERSTGVSGGRNAHESSTTGGLHRRSNLVWSPRYSFIGASRMPDFEIGAVKDRHTEQSAAREYWRGLDNYKSFYAKPQPWSEFMADRILATGPKSVFEFGCNVGKNIAAILNQNPSVFASGADINANAAEYGRQTGLRLTSGDEHLLSAFPDKTFDVTFTVSVLDHVATPGEIIQEMARITRHHIFLLEPWLGEEGKVEKNVNIRTGEMVDTTPYSYSWDYHRLAAEHVPEWAIQDEPYYLDSNLGRFYRLYTLTRQ